MAVDVIALVCEAIRKMEFFSIFFPSATSAKPLAEWYTIFPSLTTMATKPGTSSALMAASSMASILAIRSFEIPGTGLLPAGLIVCAKTVAPKPRYSRQ